MNKAIELIGLAKEYCGKRVIDDLSLEVEDGEIFGFFRTHADGDVISSLPCIAGISADQDLFSSLAGPFLLPWPLKKV